MVWIEKVSLWTIWAGTADLRHRQAGNVGRCIDWRLPAYTHNRGVENQKNCLKEYAKCEALPQERQCTIADGKDVPVAVFSCPEKGRCGQEADGAGRKDFAKWRGARRWG